MRRINLPGPVGPLHGIPVIMKDQADVKGMPTTLGSVLFKDYFPDRDSFVADKLKKGRRGDPGESHAGRIGRRRHPRLALWLDAQSVRHRAHGGRFFRRFGRRGLGKFFHRRRWTGRPGVDPPAVDLERHRRHAPIGGPGQPRRRLWLLAGDLRLARADGAHGKGSRQVARRHGRLRSGRSDHGARRRPHSRQLHEVSRQGRISRARVWASCANPSASTPNQNRKTSKKSSEVFDKAVGELKAAGAEIVDPIAIPKINELLAKRSGGPGDTEQSFQKLLRPERQTAVQIPQEATASPDFAKVVKRSQERFKKNPTRHKHYESLKAQDELMTQSF